MLLLLSPNLLCSQDQSSRWSQESLPELWEVGSQRAEQIREHQLLDRLSPHVPPHFIPKVCRTWMCDCKTNFSYLWRITKKVRRQSHECRKLPMYSLDDVAAPGTTGERITEWLGNRFISPLEKEVIISRSQRGSRPTSHTSFALWCFHKTGRRDDRMWCIWVSSKLVTEPFLKCSWKQQDDMSWLIVKLNACEVANHCKKN